MREQQQQHHQCLLQAINLGSSKARASCVCCSHSGVNDDEQSAVAWLQGIPCLILACLSAIRHQQQFSDETRLFLLDIAFFIITSLTLLITKLFLKTLSEKFLDRVIFSIAILSIAYYSALSMYEHKDFDQLQCISGDYNEESSIKYKELGQICGNNWFHLSTSSILLFSSGGSGAGIKNQFLLSLLWIVQIFSGVQYFKASWQLTLAIVIIASGFHIQRHFACRTLLKLEHKINHAKQEAHFWRGIVEQHLPSQLCMLVVAAAAGKETNQQQKSHQSLFRLHQQQQQSSSKHLSTTFARIGGGDQKQHTQLHHHPSNKTIEDYPPQLILQFKSSAIRRFMSSSSTTPHTSRMTSTSTGEQLLAFLGGIPVIRRRQTGGGQHKLTSFAKQHRKLKSIAAAAAAATSAGAKTKTLIQAAASAGKRQSRSTVAKQRASQQSFFEVVDDDEFFVRRGGVHDGVASAVVVAAASLDAGVIDTDNSISADGSMSFAAAISHRNEARTFSKNQQLSQTNLFDHLERGYTGGGAHRSFIRREMSAGGGGVSSVMESGGGNMMKSRGQFYSTLSSSQAKLHPIYLRDHEGVTDNKISSLLFSPQTTSRVFEDHHPFSSDHSHLPSTSRHPLEDDFPLQEEEEDEEQEEEEDEEEEEVDDDSIDEDSDEQQSLLSLIKLILASKAKALADSKEQHFETSTEVVYSTFIWPGGGGCGGGGGGGGGGGCYSHLSAAAAGTANNSENESCNPSNILLTSSTAKIIPCVYDGRAAVVALLSMQKKSVEGRSAHLGGGGGSVIGGSSRSAKTQIKIKHSQNSSSRSFQHSAYATRRITEHNENEEDQTISVQVRATSQGGNKNYLEDDHRSDARLQSDQSKSIQQEMNDTSINLVSPPKKTAALAAAPLPPPPPPPPPTPPVRSWIDSCEFASFQRRIIASIAHELRTPLNTVISQVEEIQASGYFSQPPSKSPPPPPQQQTIDLQLQSPCSSSTSSHRSQQTPSAFVLLKSNVSLLHHKVEELLSYSMYLSGESTQKISRFSLESILLEVSEIFAPQAKMKAIYLHTRIYLLNSQSAAFHHIESSSLRKAQRKKNQIDEVQPSPTLQPQKTFISSGGFHQAYNEFLENSERPTNAAAAAATAAASALGSSNQRRSKFGKMKFLSETGLNVPTFLSETNLPMQSVTRDNAISMDLGEMHTKKATNGVVSQTNIEVAGEQQIIEADKGKLMCILINLLSNALRYTFKGGICLTVSQVETHLFEFSIADTGIGIEETLVEKLNSTSIDEYDEAFILETNHHHHQQQQHQQQHQQMQQQQQQQQQQHHQQQQSVMPRISVTRSFNEEEEHQNGGKNSVFQKNLTSSSLKISGGAVPPSMFGPLRHSHAKQMTSFGGQFRRNCGLGVKIAKILSDQLSYGLSELVITSKHNIGSTFTFVVMNIAKAPGKLAHRLRQQLVKLPTLRIDRSESISSTTSFQHHFESPQLATTTAPAMTMTTATTQVNQNNAKNIMSLVLQQSSGQLLLDTPQETATIIQADIRGGCSPQILPSPPISPANDTNTPRNSHTSSVFSRLNGFIEQLPGDDFDYIVEAHQRGGNSITLASDESSHRHSELQSYPPPLTRVRHSVKPDSLFYPSEKLINAQQLQIDLSAATALLCDETSLSVGITTGQTTVQPLVCRKSKGDLDHLAGFNQLNANTMRLQTVLKKKTVLVVDDMPFNIYIIRQYLKFVEGLEIREAFNGKEAIDAIVEVDKNNKKKKFDLVFMDINMPIMDGIEACSEINRLIQDKVISHVPVIIVSAISADETILAKAGAVAYLVKPISVSSLEAAVYTAFNKM